MLLVAEQEIAAQKARRALAVYLGEEMLIFLCVIVGAEVFQLAIDAIDAHGFYYGHAIDYVYDIAAICWLLAINIFIILYILAQNADYD